ncbi:unnamed protein product [Cuscuta epithymum]|uniref:Uncharacterized protein n=1 Tax=Cuscuta epithymum TaxID=186058 RepID=A0AAV0EB93_9ASTE|nr:unnamed protein product [Cuscuta epithymum]
MAYLPKPLAAASFLAAILLLLIHFSNAQHYQVDLANSPAPSPQPQVIDCNGACKGRCEKSKRPNLCNRSCGSCCARCNCVPHGTSGNYEDCPCYFKLTTHNNTRKCP